MSYRTILYSVRVDSETLLNLFLGRGELNIVLEGETTTIEGIGGRHITNEEENIEFHSIKISGVSDNPNIVDVDGVGTLTVLGDTSSTFNLDLEIHLQDMYD